MDFSTLGTRRMSAKDPDVFRDNARGIIQGPVKVAVRVGPGEDSLEFFQLQSPQPLRFQGLQDGVPVGVRFDS